jgi:ABC-type transporter Mla subunit MlaD
MRSLLPERPASRELGRPFLVGLGLLGLGMALGLVWVGFNAPNAIPGRSYYYLYANFKHADNVTAHYQVRVDGKLDGQVLDPHVEHGLAVVKLQMDPSVAPLRSDTTAIVRPRSAVGVRYVELTPGLHGRPLRSGDTIPASQTSSTTQLDDVLSTFDPITRHNTQLFVKSFGKGLAGRGGDLSSTLGAAPSFLTGARDVLGAVADRTGATANVIRGAGTLATTADPVRDQIALGFRPEANALQPFADRSATLHDALSQAPPTLGELQSQLPSVQQMAAELGGFARAIRPALHAAPRSLSETSALLAEARPGLVAARRVLDTAGKAVPPVLDLLATVRPVLSPIDQTFKSSTPILNVLGLHGCDFVRFGTYWTSMQSFGNSAGNVLRFNIVSPDVSSVYGQTKPTDGVFSDPYPAPCVAGHEKLP